MIVHVGFAISRVDREEAERSYEVLESMGLLKGELESELEDIQTETSSSNWQGSEGTHEVSG